MALLANFSSPNCILVINGRQISEYSESSAPVSITQLNDKSILKRGMNGNAIKYTRVNEGYELELSLLPDSADSTFLSGLYNTDAEISAIYTTMSTLEQIVLAEGYLLSDNLDWWDEKVFTFKFNKAVKTPGASI